MHGGADDAQLQLLVNNPVQMITIIPRCCRFVLTRCVFWLDVSSGYGCSPLTGPSDDVPQHVFSASPSAALCHSVCGRGLWPAADKRVAMRRNACWACCTSIISMASHAPPSAPTIVFSLRPYRRSTLHPQQRTFCAFVLFWQLIRSIVSQYIFFPSLLVPSHFFLLQNRWLNYYVCFGGFFFPCQWSSSSAVIFAREPSDGCVVWPC